MIPPDEFGAKIGCNKDLEGPFAVAEGVIVRQGDALGFAVLDIIPAA